MKTIYIIPIEPIDARYTKQWYTNIPRILKEEISKRNLNFRVDTIEGVQTNSITTQGAFLDFADTNIYKASQTQKISKLFKSGQVKPGDKFLVTDAWNFAITALKYMSDLLEIPVEIHGIWHAGAYDPTDILGYKMAKPWPWYQELAWFHSCDYNYFATDFHKDMFLKNLLIDTLYHNRAVRSGQPHTPLIKECGKYWSVPKKKSLLWPHRYNDDKQPNIAEDISSLISGNTIITQKMRLSKEEYYRTMGQCSVVFSCSLHENLGISVMESVLAGVVPVLPNRCSYSEMYLPEFLYPNEWTENYDSYLNYKNNLVEFINERINNREKYLIALEEQRDILIKKYLKPTVMVDKLLS